MSELDFKRYQVQIAQGTTTFRVLRDNDAQTQVEISTPTVSVRPLRAGTYRISVRPDGITEITVRAGQAEIDGPRGSEPLARGRPWRRAERPTIRSSRLSRRFRWTISTA